MAQELHLLITLPPSLASFDPSKSKEGYEFLKRIKNYLLEINSASDSSAEINAAISVSTEANDDRITISINGVKARIPYTAAATLDDSQKLYYYISMALLKNLCLAAGDREPIANGSGDQQPPNENADFPKFILHVNEATETLLKKDSADFIQSEKWDEFISLMQDGLYYELGIQIPILKLQQKNSLSNFEFQLQMNDLLLPVDILISATQAMVTKLPDVNQFKNLQPVATVNPANNNEAFLISYAPEETTELKSCFDQNGITFWDFRGYLILKAALAAREFSASLINASLLRLMLRKTESQFPDLLIAVREKINEATLLQIIQSLLQEGIPVSDFTGILESCITIIASTDIDDNQKILFTPEQNYLASLSKGKTIALLEVNDYVNTIRMFLRNAISYKFMRGTNTLTVFLLDNTNIEAVIFEATKTESEIPSALRANLLNAVYEKTKDNVAPIILTTANLRKQVQHLIGPEFPQITLLAYTDLAPETSITPIARISI